MIRYCHTHWLEYQAASLPDFLHHGTGTRFSHPGHSHHLAREFPVGLRAGVRCGAPATARGILRWWVLGNPGNELQNRPSEIERGATWPCRPWTLNFMDDEVIKPGRRHALLAGLKAGLPVTLLAGTFPVALAKSSAEAARSARSAETSGALNADISGLPTAQDIAIGAWVRISRSGAITLLCNHAEMGQGVTTALAMLLAEELEVPLASVKVRIAPPAAQYMNPRFNRQLTGESASVRGMYGPLREAGAQVRDRLLRAAALHWRVGIETLKASNGRIRAMDGREIGYGSLAQVAARLRAEKVPLKTAADWKIVGKKIARLDTAAKVNGSAVFGIDVHIPGMVYAAIRMGPVLGSTVKSFEGQAALAKKGVLAVLSTGDGVAVVASTWWVAHRACELLQIEWNDGAGAVQSSTSLRHTFAKAITQGTPILAQDALGNVKDGMASARRVQQMEFWSHSLAHATMEPMNFSAHWNGKLMRLVGPTQYPDSAQAAVAAALSLPAQKISVETTYIGCGLGRRVETDVEVQAAKISYALKRPVKLLWSREEDMTHGFYRPIAVNRLQVGCDRQGWPVALDWMISSQSIKTRIWGWDPQRLDGTMVEYCDPPYRIANTRFQAVHTDAGLRVGFMRSVSHAFNVFANEGMIDELAKQAGRDPLDYRLALVDKGSRFEKVLNAVADLSAWRSATEAGRARGLALIYGYGSVLAMVSEVSVLDFGVVVHRVSCAADVGQVINAAGIAPQIESSVVFGLGAALMQEITFEKGQVQQRNLDSYRLPRMRDMPKIDSVILDSTGSPGGIGEPGAALVQAATANAVSTALKRRVNRLPMTPENLKRLYT
jgi:isoquinoline 1-oxidoreductase subunit beta